MDTNNTSEIGNMGLKEKLIQLLETRDSVYPWEAAFTLKIKTTEAMELLSQLIEQNKAVKFTVESKVKECTGMGCIGCDCTNTFTKQEIKFKLKDS